MKLLATLVILVLCMGRGLSQKSYSVTMHFPSQLARERINVWYDDGKDQYSTKPDSTNTVCISGPLYGRWVIVYVFYPDSIRAYHSFTNNLCVMDQPAEITFRKDGHQQDPLQQVELKNAWLLKDMGKGRLDAFVQDELTAYDDFERAHRERTDSSDSMETVLGKRLADKELEYIRQNPCEYFCMTVFREQLCRANSVKVDTLLQFFNTVFPDSLKQCFEGREALEYMQARLNIREGHMAPDYTTRDINGKMVSPADGRGKYVLLDF